MSMSNFYKKGNIIMLTPEALEAYVIEDAATEGIGLDSKHAIKSSPEYTALYNYLKLGRKAENAGKKSQDVDSYKEAIKYYKQAFDYIGKFEDVIRKVPETKGFWQRLTTSLTPLFEFKFPNQEIENVSVTPTFYTSGDIGMTINTTYKTYNSKESNATDNAVKRYYFQAMNLLKKNTAEKIKTLSTKIQMLK